MTLQHPDSSFAPPRGHYVFIDGPSIDGTLGRVIGQPPGPDTRPDWRRLESFVKRTCGPAPYSATFVFWAPGQQGFMHFLQSSGFMIALGDRFVPGQSCADLIRERIERLNQASLPDQEWQVFVGTHNEDLIAELPQLADQTDRISVFGFTEFFPDAPDLEQRIDFYDIEDDAQLFRSPLPRVEFEDAEDLLDTEPSAPFQPHLVDPPALELPVAAPTFQRLEGEDVRDFYLIVDGRSIEKALGEILGEKPNPGTRPDWGTVLEFARSRSQSADGDVKALFVHIAPGHAGFRRALKDLGYTSSPVRPDDSQPMRPVVEEFICGLLGARALSGDGGESGDAPDIMVLGHGQAIFEALSGIPDGGQRLCALGFPERMPPSEFYPRIEQLDIERDAQAFGSELPRDFGVDVDDFDPDEELARLF